MISPGWAAKRIYLTKYLFNYEVYISNVKNINWEYFKIFIRFMESISLIFSIYNGMKSTFILLEIFSRLDLCSKIKYDHLLRKLFVFSPVVEIKSYNKFKFFMLEICLFLKS